MSWELTSDRPIYLQIIDYIKLGIISGKYPIASKLPSVRELASAAAVNPNTMQKALSELETTGLIYSNRTSGRYVTDNETLICDIKKSLAKDYCSDLLVKLRSLGLNKTQIIDLVNECMNE